MTATNLFHVGVLVPDLDEATERFADVLGLTFKDPAIAHVDRFEQKSRVEQLDLRITWSIEGPPTSSCSSHRTATVFTGGSRKAFITSGCGNLIRRP